MSLRAMLWALDLPLDDPLAKLVLLVLADQADTQGAGAFPAVGTIAERVPCGRSTTQRKLRELQAAGLIAAGDQQLVAHYPANRRPTVWQLHLQGPRVEAPTPSRGPAAVPPGAPPGAPPVGHNPSNTQELTHGRGVAARRELPDGAVGGCADHPDRRRPACAECQRVVPLHREQVRPADPEVVAAARAAVPPNRREATP